MKESSYIQNVFSKIFNPIDYEAQKERKNTGGLEAYRKQVWIVLLVTSISLLAVHYLKLNTSFYHFISWLESLFSVENHTWYETIRTHTFSSLFYYLWWAGWHYIFYLIIPMIVVKKVLKKPVAEYGWQTGDSLRHWKVYAITVILLILSVSAFSQFNESFVHYYPFYKLAYRSWFDLLAWEILYISQFVALEFFFRGFLLQGLRIPFGSLSIAIMTIPYMMIHLPKLWPEATGAIIFGIFLGVLALRSRSIWGGVSIHVSVALTMDIAALLQTKGLPKVWCPV